MIISLSIEDCMLLQYADNSDLIVSDKDPSKNGQQLSKNLGCCNKWLIDNKLSLHMGKTELLLFWYKTGQDTSLSVMDKQFMLTLLFSHTYHIDQYWNALVMKWLVVSSKKSMIKIFVQTGKFSQLKYGENIMFSSGSLII